MDAEGQGDRDTKYDTMLFAPVILISKVCLGTRVGERGRDLEDGAVRVAHSRTHALTHSRAQPGGKGTGRNAVCSFLQAVILNIREGRLQKNSILEKLDLLQVPAPHSRVLPFHLRAFCILCLCDKPTCGTGCPLLLWCACATDCGWEAKH